MQIEFIFPTTLEVLTPAPDCSTPREWLAAYRELSSLSRAKQLHHLRTLFTESLSVADLLLFASGKEALYRLFTALSTCTTKRTVALSAYTCPDIAAAAVRAGFVIYAVDTKPQGLTPDWDEFISNPPIDCAAVVLSNLFGVPDDIQSLLRASHERDLLIVDDACQAALSARESTVIGCTPNTIGVYSFGRGKAYSGVGGGALIVPSASSGICKKVVDKLDSSPVRTSVSQELSDIFRSMIQWGFSNPLTYRIPTSIPGLGLGETRYRPQFPLGMLSSVALAHILAQFRSRTERALELANTANQWREALVSSELILPEHSESTILIRFPAIFRSIDQREKFLYDAQRAGLGVSGSYPAPLWGFPKLRPHLAPIPCLNAERLARTLVTFPLHRHVRTRHVESCRKLIPSAS